MPPLFLRYWRPGVIVLAALVGVLSPSTLQAQCNYGPIPSEQFDLARAVDRVQKAYDDAVSPAGSMASASREAKDSAVKEAVRTIIAEEASGVRTAYLGRECPVSRYEECTAHTGQKRICDPVTLSAPSGHAFDPTTWTREGNDAIKRGPFFEDSNRTVRFNVGKTGRGTNKVTVRVKARYTPAAIDAAEAAAAEDIRRALVARFLPVDRPPTGRSVVTPPSTRESTKPDVPKPPAPAPANLAAQLIIRQGDPSHAVLRVQNTGGTAGTLHYEIHVLDGDTGTWKLHETTRGEAGMTLQPNTIYEHGVHKFRARDWKFVRLN
jgi:hypothetical protein